MEYCNSASESQEAAVVEYDDNDNDNDNKEEEDEVVISASALIPLPSQIISRESMLATFMIGEGYKVGDSIACCHQAAGDYRDGTFYTPFSVFIDNILALFRDTLYSSDFIRTGNYMAVDPCKDMFACYSVGDYECTGVSIAAVMAYCADDAGWEKFLIDTQDITNLTQLDNMALLAIDGQTLTSGNITALRDMRARFDANDAVDRLLFLCGYLVV